MRALAIQLMLSILRLISGEVKPAANLLLGYTALHMLLNQLVEAKLNRLWTTAESMGDIRKRQVLLPAETNHLTLLSHRPVVVIASIDDAGGGNGALGDSGTGLHLVVLGNMPLCNRIRF